MKKKVYLELQAYLFALFKDLKSNYDSSFYVIYSYTSTECWTYTEDKFRPSTYESFSTLFIPAQWWGLCIGVVVTATGFNVVIYLDDQNFKRGGDVKRWED